jgi:hypothetical protein
MQWRYMRECRCSSTILDLRIRRRWIMCFMPQSLYPQGKSHWYPLYRRLSGPWSWCGRCGVEKSFASTGNRTPTIQLVACCYTNWDIPSSIQQKECSIIMYASKTVKEGYLVWMLSASQDMQESWKCTWTKSLMCWRNKSVLMKEWSRLLLRMFLSKTTWFTLIIVSPVASYPRFESR